MFSAQQTEGFGDGIITAASPWIASQDPPYGKDKPLYRSVLPESLKTILRACRGESAACRLVR